LRGDQPAELARLLEIYREAIPPSERKPDAVVAAMTKDPAYRVQLAFAGGQAIGFSIAYRCMADSIDLLEYMGVTSRLRSRGIGTGLFRRTAGDLDAARTLLLEVDSDRVLAPDAEQRRRRKIFYRRLGCKDVHGLHYIMPLGVDPPAMDLMAYPANDSTVDKALLKRWLGCIYAEVYGLDPADARIDEMLNGLPERVALT
jgi:hypothetical protein